VKRTGSKGQKAFERIVENWSSDTKPTFTTKIQVLIGVGVRITIDYKEANKNKPVWKWVNFTGTKAHRINPKPGNRYQRLFFMWGGPGSYESKTRELFPNVTKIIILTAEEIVRKSQMYFKSN